eukprot:ANDGO_00181.mRNA.1 hypothetical protein
MLLPVQLSAAELSTLRGLRKIFDAAFDIGETNARFSGSHSEQRELRLNFCADDGGRPSGIIFSLNTDVDAARFRELLAPRLPVTADVAAALEKQSLAYLGFISGKVGLHDDLPCDLCTLVGRCVTLVTKGSSAYSVQHVVKEIGCNIEYRPPQIVKNMFDVSPNVLSGDSVKTVLLELDLKCPTFIAIVITQLSLRELADSRFSVFCDAAALEIHKVYRFFLHPLSSSSCLALSKIQKSSAVAKNSKDSVVWRHFGICHLKCSIMQGINETELPKPLSFESLKECWRLQNSILESLSAYITQPSNDTSIHRGPLEYGSGDDEDRDENDIVVSLPLLSRIHHLNVPTFECAPPFPAFVFAITGVCVGVLYYNEESSSATETSVKLYWRGRQVLHECLKVDVSDKSKSRQNAFELFSYVSGFVFLVKDGVVELQSGSLRRPIRFFSADFSDDVRCWMRVGAGTPTEKRIRGAGKLRALLLEWMKASSKVERRISRSQFSSPLLSKRAIDVPVMEEGDSSGTVSYIREKRFETLQVPNATKISTFTSGDVVLLDATEDMYGLSSPTLLPLQILWFSGSACDELERLGALRGDCVLQLLPVCWFGIQFVRMSLVRMFKLLRGTAPVPSDQLPSVILEMDPEFVNKYRKYVPAYVDVYSSNRFSSVSRKLGARAEVPVGDCEFRVDILNDNLSKIRLSEQDVSPFASSTSLLDSRLNVMLANFNADHISDAGTQPLDSAVDDWLVDLCGRRFGHVLEAMLLDEECDHVVDQFPVMWTESSAFVRTRFCEEGNFCLRFFFNDLPLVRRDISVKVKLGNPASIIWKDSFLLVRFGTFFSVRFSVLDGHRQSLVSDMLRKQIRRSHCVSLDSTRNNDDAAFIGEGLLVNIPSEAEIVQSEDGSLWYEFQQCIVCSSSPVLIANSDSVALNLRISLSNQQVSSVCNVKICSGIPHSLNVMLAETHFSNLQYLEDAELCMLDEFLNVTTFAATIVSVQILGGYFIIDSGTETQTLDFPLSPSDSRAVVHFDRIRIFSEATNLKLRFSVENVFQDLEVTVSPISAPARLCFRECTFPITSGEQNFVRLGSPLQAGMKMGSLGLVLGITSQIGGDAVVPFSSSSFRFAPFIVNISALVVEVNAFPVIALAPGDSIHRLSLMKYFDDHLDHAIRRPSEDSEILAVRIMVEGCSSDGTQHRFAVLRIALRATVVPGPAVSFSVCWTEMTRQNAVTVKAGRALPFVQLSASDEFGNAIPDIVRDVSVRIVGNGNGDAVDDDAVVPISPLLCDSKCELQYICRVVREFLLLFSFRDLVCRKLVSVIAGDPVSCKVCNVDEIFLIPFAPLPLIVMQFVDSFGNPCMPSFSGQHFQISITSNGRTTVLKEQPAIVESRGRLCCYGCRVAWTPQVFPGQIGTVEIAAPNSGIPRVTFACPFRPSRRIVDVNVFAEVRNCRMPLVEDAVLVLDQEFCKSLELPVFVVQLLPEDRSEMSFDDVEWFAPATVFGIRNCPRGLFLSGKVRGLNLVFERSPEFDRKWCFDNDRRYDCQVTFRESRFHRHVQQRTISFKVRYSGVSSSHSVISSRSFLQNELLSSATSKMLSVIRDVLREWPPCYAQLPCIHRLLMVSISDQVQSIASLVRSCCADMKKLHQELLSKETEPAAEISLSAVSDCVSFTDDFPVLSTIKYSCYDRDRGLIPYVRRAFSIRHLLSVLFRAELLKTPVSRTSFLQNVSHGGHVMLQDTDVRPRSSIELIPSSNWIGRVVSASSPAIRLCTNSELFTRCVDPWLNDVWILDGCVDDAETMITDSFSSKQLPFKDSCRLTILCLGDGAVFDVYSRSVSAFAASVDSECCFRTVHAAILQPLEAVIDALEHFLQVAGPENSSAPAFPRRPFVPPCQPSNKAHMGSHRRHDKYYDDK